MDSEVCQVEIHSRPSCITVKIIMEKVLEALKLSTDEAKYFSIWLASPQLRTSIKYLTMILCMVYIW